MSNLSGLFYKHLCPLQYGFESRYIKCTTMYVYYVFVILKAAH